MTLSLVLTAHVLFHFLLNVNVIYQAEFDEIDVVRIQKTALERIINEPSDKFTIICLNKLLNCVNEA